MFLICVLTFLVDFVVGSLAAGFLVAGFLVAGSLVAGSLVVGSLVTGSLVTGSLVAGSLVAGSLVVGSLVTGSLVVGFLNDLVAFAAVSDLIFGGGEENKRSIVCEVTLCYRLLRPNLTMKGTWKVHGNPRHVECT